MAKKEKKRKIYTKSQIYLDRTKVNEYLKNLGLMTFKNNTEYQNYLDTYNKTSTDFLDELNSKNNVRNSIVNDMKSLRGYAGIVDAYIKSTNKSAFNYQTIENAKKRIAELNADITDKSKYITGELSKEELEDNLTDNKFIGNVSDKLAMSFAKQYKKRNFSDIIGTKTVSGNVGLIKGIAPKNVDNSYMRKFLNQSIKWIDKDGNEHEGILSNILKDSVSTEDLWKFIAKQRKALNLNDIDSDGETSAIVQSLKKSNSVFNAFSQFLKDDVLTSL